MKYVNLGRSGLKVSRLCLGCMSYGEPERLPQPWSLDEKASRPLIRQALEAGINFFDTANIYSGGSSEEITGKALREMARRDEIVVATKTFFPWRNSPNTGFLSRKAIFQSIDDSLMRLGMDYVDLFQIHRFGVDPILMTEARWALTALLLGLLYRRQIAGSRHLLRANAPAVVVLTLCGQVSFPLTLYIGLQTTSALNAAIYMSATPSMVLLINRLFFRDPVSGRNWLGVAFSTLGVMILLFQGNPLHAASLHTFAIGDLWAMGSALSWALYCSLLRLKDRRIPANGFVAVSSLLGALILVPIVIFWLMRHPAQDWAAWREPFYLSGLAYLVIFPSWLAYLFWNKGIASIGATRGEIYTHIIPLSGGVLSILFLHTQLQAWHLFSALFIMLGIVICSLEKRQATGRLATPGHKS
ncbi:hypothetical protein EA161_24235 [Klebsiella pneumoniae]|nr:hypothetical protein EA161_24235 [Klebsiella pneumoniae]